MRIRKVDEIAFGIAIMRSGVVGLFFFKWLITIEWKCK